MAVMGFTKLEPKIVKVLAAWLKLSTCANGATYLYPQSRVLQTISTPSTLIIICGWVSLVKRNSNGRGS